MAPRNVFQQAWVPPKQLHDARAAAAGHLVEHLETLGNRRVVFAQPLPPAADGGEDTALVLLRVAGELVVEIRDEQQRAETGDEEARLHIRSTVEGHPEDDLLQRGGQRAGIVGPQRGESVGMAFAAPAHEERDELREDADDVEENRHDDEAGNTARRREEALLLLLDLVLQLVEQRRRLAGAEDAVEQPGQALRHDQAERRTEHRCERGDGDVVSLHVSELVRQDGLEFVIGQTDIEQTFRRGDEGIARIAAGGEGIRHGQRRDVNRRLHGKTGLGIELVDETNQTCVVGVAQVWRLATHQFLDDSARVIPAEKRKQNPEAQDDGADGPVEPEVPQTTNRQGSQEQNTERRLDPGHGDPALDGGMIVCHPKVPYVRVVVSGRKKTAITPTLESGMTTGFSTDLYDLTH